MIVDLLIVLVAAKAAAEVSERIRVPAVLGEITAGILVGPSVLGLVRSSEPLAFLAELGVVVLLLNVGLETDVAELRAVGRASVLVAVVGIVAPFAGGAIAMSALGEDVTVAVFVGAALTATSVGITARVFGDLRALATVEARTVLGAAVADDVLGLVILTVVVRLSTAGDVSVAEVAAVIAAATAFLVVGGFVAVRTAPGALAFVTRGARSAGALLVAAIALTLALAGVAELAGLAPIIGAFLAGIAIAPSRSAERVRRDVAPIAQLLVPVFFLHIGLDVELGVFARPAVIGVAGVLLAVAVVGKLVSPIGALGSPGDRLLIGLGMLPRGEVGLIFAGIGLTEGVLGDDLYAALLAVVLGTTLATPPLLRWRIDRLRATQRTVEPVTPVPEGGWLASIDGIVVLRGTPPPRLALVIGLEAAVLVASAAPSARLLQWFTSLTPTDHNAIEWDAAARAQLIALLHAGNPRSWRFLESVGLLDAVLPELAETLERRRADASELDPAHVFTWTTVEAARDLADSTEFDRLDHPDWLLLAALVLDAAGDADSDASAAARRIAERLGLPEEGEEEVACLVAERGMLRAAALRPDALDEARVLPLAAHLGTAERARSQYLLELAEGGFETWQRERLDALHDRLQRVIGDTGEDVAERRRREAEMLDDRPHVRERLRNAPRPWFVTQPPGALARHAALLDPLPRPNHFRVDASGGRIAIAARDRTGLLARVAAVVSGAGLEIHQASTATWADGAVAMSFVVRPTDVDAGLLQQRLEAQADRLPLPATAVPDAHVRVDQHASPWYTIIDVVAADRPGLLASLAAACTTAGASIHGVDARTADGVASDRFELTDRRGAKLDGMALENLRMVLAGATPKTRKALTRTKQSSDSLETARP